MANAIEFVGEIEAAGYIREGPRGLGRIDSGRLEHQLDRAIGQATERFVEHVQTVIFDRLRGLCRHGTRRHAADEKDSEDTRVKMHRRSVHFFSFDAQSLVLYPRFTKAGVSS